MKVFITALALLCSGTIAKAQQTNVIGTPNGISNGLSATLQANISPAPTSTTSASAVMMGTGATCKLTPVYSGRIKFEFIGTASNNTATGVQQISARYGTGTAPSNGVAATGTAVGGNPRGTVDANNGTLFFVSGGIITGLTPGTAYWFDITLAATVGGTASVSDISCNAFEF